jgi:uncharacterized protein (TIGR02266 family)
MQKKVLLVDDVDLLIELEKTFFWRVEIDLLVARNGLEALQIIKDEHPDLVFLDLHMPVMNGDECCRKVKADPKLRAIPIIMLPHEGNEADLKRCRDAGCDTVVFKPINRHHFVDRARKFLHLTTRAAPRVRTRLSISFGPETRKMLQDYTFNLSTGGIFVESKEIHPVDTPLEVIFTLPELKSGLRCRTRVAWVNTRERIINPLLPPGMGIQFLDISLEEMEVIFAFVKKEFLSQSFFRSR